jgi:hypothetical protein
MRATKVALLSMTLLIFGLLLAGCVTTTADGVQLQPLAGGNGGDPAAALGIDSAAYVILDLERSGGIAGLAERARLFLDGHVLLERRDQEPAVFQLSQAEQAQLSAALDAADFYRNAAQTQPPTQALPDAFQYRIRRRGVLLQGEVLTQDGAAPAWLQPLLPLLSNLLLTPDPTRLQPLPPPATAVTATAPLSQTAAAPGTAEAPSIVVLEYVRSQPGAELRALVNLDRSYSLAGAGRVVEGELTREEMATLTRLVEQADLRGHAGDYTPAEPCADCATYTVTYRNLLGGATVRGEAGSLPEWFQTLASALEETFSAADLAAPAALTPSPALTATVAATSTTDLTTPAPSTVTPAAPAPAAAFTVETLLSELAGTGAQVQVTPGRITKPYLSVPGIVVRVDGRPVQLFEYADAAALAADVATLAPNAGSIAGVPLTWAATPHFWRRDGLLALAVSDDQTLVELLSRVLGPQFAGR